MNLVIHIPHASTVIPPEVRASFLLTPEALSVELLAMTDWFTGELFACPSSMAATVAAPVSRLAVDVERFRDDTGEVMAARGMGAIYTRTADGLPLRLAADDAEREAWLARWYDPHHAALTRAVAHALQSDGHCLIVDGHSFPSVPLPYELDQRADRPDICIGTDPFHTPPALRDFVRDYFEARDYSVAIDRPFAGALVPLAFYRKAPDVFAIMIEVNRGLYMDERTGAKSAGFADVQADIRACLVRLAEILASFAESA